MLWVALHFPQLSLDIIERCWQQTDSIAVVQGGAPLAEQPAPLAICDRLAILSANDSALAGGIQPGMKRASAQALLPEIQLLDHDPVREQQALTTLACWALQFTPSTGFAPPPLVARRSAPPTTIAPLPEPGQAGLLMEIEPSLKYFGGLPALLRQLHTGLQQLGYRAHTGLAPTPTGAWLLALHQGNGEQHRGEQHRGEQHHGEQHHNEQQIACAEAQSTTQLQRRLAPLPLTLLASAHAHGAALAAIGARTFGDLLELPRAGLARRFGKTLLLEVDCALGSQAQPIGFFNAPQRFRSRLELQADVEQADALLFAARRLLVELTGWLSARQAAVRSFDLIAQHSDAPVTALSVRLNDASRDINRLTGLLRERLNVLQLRAPVHTLELRCDRIQSLAVNSDELFASAASTHESLGRLLERLQVRLGREQVQRLHLAQDHRPEAAYQIQMVDSLEQLGKPAISKPASGKPRKKTTGSVPVISPPMSDELFCTHTGSLPRPLWLLREPLALRERNNRPWLHSMLSIVAGPERIETGWWDTKMVQRDYFVAEDDTHTLYWIYRDRKAAQGSGWYVHGRFG